MADTSEMSTKYHTATHLLLASLRKVVGEHIHQLGSNITTERLRLDFPNKEKLTEEQLKKVEDMVNEVIENNLDISFEEMNKEDALATIQKYSSTASFDDLLNSSASIIP